ncbi:MAG: hypothetical protein QNJ30_25995 [Kiloniellales bacterium]|nr:hypothetical protein [Kiloniellales bacterium]
MSPSAVPAQVLDLDHPDLTTETLDRPPVAFRESWRVIPLPRERSLVVGVLCHWANLAGDAALPRIGALDPEALPVAWRNCLLARREPLQESWSFEYLGEAFAATGFDPSGSPNPRLGSSLQSRILRWFDLAFQARRPITLGGGFRREDGQRARFRTLLLPFGEADGGVTHLLAAVTARPLLSLEPHHLPLEAHAYIDGFWVHQPALP